MRNTKKLVLLPGVAAIIVGGVIACSPGTSSTSAPAPAQSSTSAPAAPAPVASSAAPVAPPAPPAPPAPSTPSMTAGQQQAVTSAQGYLSDGEGFSYNGLLQQLTSSAGEGFANSDAAFALNYLNPDWNAQAVIAAKGYLADGEGFSRSSLIQQLTSAYGDGFTEAQAEYGVTQAGL